MVRTLRKLGDLLDRPAQGCPQAFPQHRATGFADGRQPLESPLFRTVLPQLPHEQAVRQHDQVHVPGLALASAKLTIPHAKLLLTVPMKGLRTCPAMAIDLQNPADLPLHAVAHQDFARSDIVPLVPDNDQPHPMRNRGDRQGAGEIPLPSVATAQFLAVGGSNALRQFVSANDLAFPLQLTVGFQIADIAAGPVEAIFLGVDVVQILGIGEIAVEDEVTGNMPHADPVDQLAEQHRVVLELQVGGFTKFALAKAAKLQGIMLAARANVVDEQVIVGDLVALFGVIPEPTHIGDELALMVNEHIVDGNNAMITVTGAGLFLEQLQTPFVEFTNVPHGVGEKAVQTRLIAGLGELAVDAAHGLALRQEQPRQVFAEMPPLGLAAEEVGEVGLGLLNHLRQFHDPWHGGTLPGQRAPCEYLRDLNEIAHLDKAS